MSDLQRYTWILYLITDVEDIVVFLAWEVRDFYIFLSLILREGKTQVIFVTKQTTTENISTYKTNSFLIRQSF